MVDAGTAGWREFPDFRSRVIDRAHTRVLALLNIVGAGMGWDKENDAAEMDAEAAAGMAKANADVIVGFKSAHYEGPGWESIDNAVKAGNLTNLPVMVDFGRINQLRNIGALFLDKLRPGDIYTHCYSGHRQELLETGKVNPAMWAGRKRGIIFDGRSPAAFTERVAKLLNRQGIGTRLSLSSNEKRRLSVSITTTEVPRFLKSRALLCAASNESAVASITDKSRRPPSFVLKILSCLISSNGGVLAVCINLNLCPHTTPMVIIGHHAMRHSRGL